MSPVRPAWPLVLLAVAACFADRPPAQGPSTGEASTGEASTGGTTTGATTDATGQGTTGGTTASEDCPPGMSPEPWYIDQDGDGWGVGAPVLACAKPTGHAAQVGDCDDQVNEVNPGAVELCNELDDDCDALIDEYSFLNEACGACTLRERDGVAWWLCAVDGPDWKAARDACKGFGAALASLHGADENTWLYDQVMTLGLDLQPDTTTLWLGLRRTDAVSGDCTASLDGWTWIDGSAIDWFDGWATGQPDNHPTADGCDDLCTPMGLDDPACPRENCLDLIGIGGWNDVPCDLAGQGYVCRGPA